MAAMLKQKKKKEAPKEEKPFDLEGKTLTLTLTFKEEKPFDLEGKTFTAASPTLSSRC